MPFCPKCKDEFRPEISVCANCNVALVDSLEEDQEMEELAVACNIAQEENAYIIRGFLESEGIPCQLENMSFHASPAPATLLTKVRLWVRKTDLEQARSLIEEHENFNLCSSCGHVVNASDTTCDFCGESLED